MGLVVLGVFKVSIDVLLSRKMCWEYNTFLWNMHFHEQMFIKKTNKKKLHQCHLYAIFADTSLILYDCFSAYHRP